VIKLGSGGLGFEEGRLRERGKIRDKEYGNFKSHLQKYKSSRLFSKDKKGNQLKPVPVLQYRKCCILQTVIKC
jgi:hypothetical protein